MNKKPDTIKPWGGRFASPTDKFVEQFTESVSYDQRLYHYDIMGSIAHVKMLSHVGVLSPEESETIVKTLMDIEKSIEEGSFNWDISLEDVHMNIEAELTNRIGETGKKLHTGRSRNDQVATDLRLYLRDEVNHISHLLKDTMMVLLDLAEQEADTVMPGFTHLQMAQPVTFGHHMLAWFDMLIRDAERLQDCLKRINRMPLGAAALAGTSFPIDREYTAKLLGFDGLCENSIDAVSDRDFAIEFCGACALIMMHLSRFSEEIILWMSQQFCFVQLDDAWCTGSSIMPQKKNPDIPELVRGKTARVYGHLMGLLTLMKAQPLAYNRDNQEDKEALFDTVDTVKNCLQAYIGLIPAMTVQRENLEAAVKEGFVTATDLADYLVRKGLTFRDAHAVVGQLIQLAIDQDTELSGLTLEQLQQYSSLIEKDVFNYLTPAGSLASRTHPGGTAPERVRSAVISGRQRLQNITV